MLISYNWLRELTGTQLAPLELRERLTMVGLAIDSVDDSEEDSVLDVEVPSNRPDCLSHIGIAREVAVIEKSKVESPQSKSIKTQGKTSDFAAVEIVDSDLCPRYAARVIRGVRIAPSPEWLVERLASIGQRPINNVADITNYVLHEMGQPLHAFDLVKLTDHRIVVRRARDGEKLTTLDGVARTLDSGMLVIADAKEAVALAGIMGGQDSEISDTTTDVLIESAYFNAESVRRTARKLGMDTEASRRFERGADCENVLAAQNRCVELICDVAGGTATEDPIDVYPEPLQPRTVSFRPARVESLTSLRVEAAEIMRILQALGFTVSSNGGETKTFVIPSWRGDVNIEEDLIEEVARHTGYDRIASELPPATMAGEYQPAETKLRLMRRLLANLGFDEAINFSFIDTAHDDDFQTVPALAESASLVTLANPILEGATRMRPSLLAGLLESLRTNLNHGSRDVRLFEIGRIFAGSAAEGELPVERVALGLVTTGGMTEQDRMQSVREADFYDLKGAIEAAVDAMKFGPIQAQAAQVKHLRSGQAAQLKVAGQAIGTLGQLAEPIASAYKFRQPVFVAELDVTSLLESTERRTQYTPLPRYPSVVRDVTVWVSRTTTFDDLVHAIDDARVEDYRRAKLVGTFEGKNIPEDKRAVTLRIEYRSNERTLRDDEVEERHRAIVDLLLNKFNAELH